jgi:hypothetical protein
MILWRALWFVVKVAILLGLLYLAACAWVLLGMP